MHAILDAILILGRVLLFLVEAVFNLFYALKILYDTGCGLRWLFSAEYRKALRGRPDGPAKRLKRLSMIYGLLLAGIVVTVGVLFVSKTIAGV